VNRFLALSLAAVTACAHPRPAPTASPSPIRLVVVGTNDVHGWLTPREGRLPHGTVVRHGGLSQLGGYLRPLRAQVPDGVLLFDSGDLFQGTLIANETEGEAVIATMRALGYDAAALGNHEFDYGPCGPRSTAKDGDDAFCAISARAKEAGFPLLARNVHLAASDERPAFIAPEGVALLERHGLRIGVVGLVTPDTPSVTNPINVRALRFSPLLEEAQSAVTLLRAKGADILVALIHAGGECKNPDPRALDSCDQGELRSLLEALPHGSFDVVLGAHTHTRIGHFINGMPVIQSLPYAREFGMVELFVDPQTRRPIPEATRIRSGIALCASVFEGTEQCDPKQAPANPTLVPARFEGQLVEPDASVMASLAPYQKRVEALQARSLNVRVPTSLTRDRQAESPLGNALADALRAMEGADVALLNSGGLRADLPAGGLTYGALHSVMPFDNTVSTLSLTGDELVRLLETMLSGSHGAPQVSGPTFQADRCRGKATIVRMEISGRPLDRKALYRVATSDFLALGGDGAALVLDAVPSDRKDLGQTRDFNMRDALANWLTARGGSLTGEADGRWKLIERCP